MSAQSLRLNIDILGTTELFSMSSFVYLDNAATTRISAAARAVLCDVYDHDGFANPSSTHGAGDAALRLLEQARAHIAKSLGARPREVIFTSGGSEANNQALLSGAAYGAQMGRRHIVASAIEHPSILRMLDRLASPDGPYGGNFSITLVKPSAQGFLDVPSIKAALREDTCLVSVMVANNEVGSIQPVRNICGACHKRGILFHTDAVQAAGHVPLAFDRDGFDFMSISAHKFHGPRGTGALLCSPHVQPVSLIEGGSQERGWRAGTVDVASASSMAVALVEACDNLEYNTNATADLRKQLETGIAHIPGSHFFGPADSEPRLAGTLNIALEGVHHEAALVLLDEYGICVSAGSACAAGVVENSHVLAAMGIPPELAQGSIRFSLDAQENTVGDVECAVTALTQVAQELRTNSANIASRDIAPEHHREVLQ